MNKESNNNYNLRAMIKKMLNSLPNLTVEYFRKIYN